MGSTVIEFKMLTLLRHGNIHFNNSRRHTNNTNSSPTGRFSYWLIEHEEKIVPFIILQFASHIFIIVPLESAWRLLHRVLDLVKRSIPFVVYKPCFCHAAFRCGGDKV